MSTIVASRPMAKKKTSPTVQVRIPAEVAEVAAIVAAYEGRQAGEVIAEIAGPVLAERHARHAAAASARIKKGGV